MIIYIVKEVSILDSGERSFYATPFKEEKDAKKEIELVLEGLIEDEYEITYEDKDEIHLKDESRNIYEVSMEVKTLL